MSHITLLESMKKNAPVIYEAYKTKRIAQMNGKVEELRIKYKEAQENKDQEEMIRIEKTTAELKKHIQVYHDIDAQTVIV